MGLSNQYKDETQKLSIYEEYGVKEYWIVNPDIFLLLIEGLQLFFIFIL